MDFRGDERAVTVQIGAVLLFGIIIISMSMYQATVVPNQNEQVEFQHNQDVHNEFVTLRGAVVESAAKSTPTPTTVSLGTRYPSRTLFVNPGPATGTLQTRSLGTFAVSNVSTNEAETSDYVTDNRLSFTTKALEYRPGYNVMQNAPTTVYENTVAYNRFDNGYNGTLSGQSLVDGRTISLVLLAGNYSENGVGSATIDAQAVSRATRTVSVTNNASANNVTITVPTKLSADDWRTILTDAEELDGSGDTSNDAYVHAVREGPTDESVVFVMERGATYDLRIGNVGVGSGIETPSPHYLTTTGPSSETVDSGGSETVTFEVRDRYNNPVSGVSVNFSASSAAVSLSTDSATTDADGRVEVTVTGQSAGTAAVLGSFDDDTFASATRQDASVSVTVSSGGSGGGVGGLLYENDAVGRDGDDSGSTRGGIEFSLQNVGTDSVEVLDVVVNPHDDRINGLSDRVGQGDNDPGETEFYVESPSGDGRVDYLISQSEYVTVPDDGIATDLDEDGNIAGPNPVVGSGESAKFYVYEFFDDGSNVNMVDEWVTARVSYRLPNGLVDSKTYTFRVNDAPPDGNSPPTARAGGPYTVSEGGSIQLDGSSSSDDDGTVDSYSWAITNDPTGGASISNAGSETPTFDAPSSVSGDTDVTVRLTVTDDDGATDTTTTTVTVQDTGGGNDAPTVDITDIQVFEAGNSGNVQTVTVAFSPDDANGDLRTGTVFVRVGGVLTDTASFSLTGAEGRTVTAQLSGNQNRGLVEVTVVVSDSQSATGSDTKDETQV
ncbi:PKD domain-containing protein [Haloferax mucosum ATCC BAA-1512]|uniref:PKD domain-containing protein n=1 Tax=Haloferax mucosum ATCC BAA-1512 TaxID=662479 RepID=M0ILQ5_9EURY|nr:Ig-like domain-containing protein [Haloferax mucosum]ELZ96788.1 PKD domain-containing protein [Haloferax mucosum ATCC BAA-1512]